jgi:hypothetical protein
VASNIFFRQKRRNVYKRQNSREELVPVVKKITVLREELCYGVIVVADSYLH